MNTYKTMSKDCTRLIGTLSLLLLLTACGGGQRSSGRLLDDSDYRTSTERGGYYKVGRPYQIKGQWYYPAEDYSYDEMGIASWYGDDFHSLKTANGETYNKNELTAAHKTLPLPSLARVTNLDNGRSIVVRVNDRGPFSGARIIDVSQRSAQLLGFEKKGTAKVRVQVMAEESKAIADAMRSYGSSTGQETVASVPAQIPSDAPFQTASSPPVQTASIAQTPSSVPSSISNFKPPPIVEQVAVTGNNQIYVQAGSFTNVENARKLQSKLVKLGHTTMTPVQVKSVQYYRVRLGPIPNVAQADKLLKKVVNAGYDSAKIIVD
ncbi:MAG: septal ring lytic transglycosylase RlpA family protein [Proteobacteria bacterium]|jgi:rare lipoprotein A|nr:septal ring lytic transglycosylase RlpA family protein [Pseudomonadota bacterium]